MPGRDKPLITRNGIPDPQAYNPQTGQWESFIGVSWGKTAGGLYVPIRVDDQGCQEVTLSGTIARLLRTINSFLGIEGGTGNTLPRIYGMNIVNQFDSVRPIPIQNHERKIIVVTNDYDTAHNIIVFGTYENKVGFASGEYYHLVPSVQVPAKATRVFTSVEYPLLAEPFIGLFVWGQPSAPPTEGSLRIVVMGR